MRFTFRKGSEASGGKIDLNPEQQQPGRGPRRFPWKRNLRMVPRAIDLKVASFRGNAIQAAVAKRVPQSDLESNLYGHLGITWNEDGPNFSEDILPDPSVGRWSKTNVHGYEVVRKDLP